MTASVRRRLAVGLVALMALAVLAWGPTPKVDAAGFDRRENALWLGHRFFSGQASPEDCQQLYARLSSCGIRDVYLHVGGIDEHGNIPDWDADGWSRRLASLRQAVPGVRVWAWVAGRTMQDYAAAPDHIDMESTAARDGVVTTAENLISAFDGIHYDIDRIPDDDEGFLKLLVAHRQRVPGLLSISTPMVKRPVWPTEYQWSSAFFHRAAAQCDQIAVHAFSTCMPTQTLYKRVLADQVQAAMVGVSNTSCRLVFALTTASDTTLSHYPWSETLPAGLDGVAWGLQRAGNPAAFQGVGLYAEYDMVPSDWACLQQHWAVQR